MSIKEKVGRADVRSIIDSLYPKPKTSLHGTLEAPAKTENYAEMGAAFNYLFTFWLASHHEQTDIARWPTQSGLTTIKNDYPEYEADAHTQVDAAEHALAVHIDTGELTDDLCHASLDLARIEAAYKGDTQRASHLLSRLGTYDDEDVADLHQLYNLIPDDFTTFDTITVNPAFGPVEYTVGGIDADVVCDSTLLDLKTTKHLTLKVSYWRKLVAYATLADIAQSAGPQLGDESPIDRPEELGIYYSRHGALWTTSTDPIYTHPQYGEFKDWFLDAIRD